MEILNATAYFLTPPVLLLPLPQTWLAHLTGQYLPDNPHLYLSTVSDFMLGRLFITVIQYIQIYIIFRTCQRVGALQIQKVPQIAKPQICYICGPSANVAFCEFRVFGLKIFSVICRHRTFTRPQIYTFSPFKYNTVYKRML
jgi:hypothetical protein